VITNDKAIMGMHATLAEAEDHARLIKANNVRIVSLYRPEETTAVGYLVVPDSNLCACCGQFVEELK
jgi:hypothetical protein